MEAGEYDGYNGYNEYGEYDWYDRGERDGSSSVQESDRRVGKNGSIGSSDGTIYSKL